MGMNVNLTPQLEEMVWQKVDSGLYSSASEIVCEALRLMEEQDRLRAARMEQLRQDIRDQNGRRERPVIGPMPPFTRSRKPSFRKDSFHRARCDDEAD